MNAVRFFVRSARANSFCLCVAGLLTVMFSCNKPDVDLRITYAGNDAVFMADELFLRGMRRRNTGSDSLLWYAERLIRLDEDHGDEQIMVN